MLFDGCSGLTSIDIPSSVTKFGTATFRGCTSLTSIDIPSSVTSLGSYLFQDCIALTSIDIPSSVTTIYSGVFKGCTALTSIDIPSSVTLFYCQDFDLNSIVFEDVSSTWTVSTGGTHTFTTDAQANADFIKSIRGGILIKE